MKDKILDTVARLIERYGLKKFTVDEVAAELRISKKTLYQYFNSKDEMIREYFEQYMASDRQSVLETVNSQGDFIEKVHSIVHSSHRYRMPLQVLNEAQQFYPEEWAQIEEMKQFKLDVLQKLLKQAADQGILRTNVHFAILSAMLERVSNMFIDTDFLLEHGLKATQAIDEALNIIIYGVVKEDSRIS